MSLSIADWVLILWKNLMNALVNSENENDNDHDLCPLKFLTWEEREFVENDFKKKFSNGQQ